MKRTHSILALSTILLLGIGSEVGAQTTITFSAFPGPDNTLGTADDIPINATNGVQFTNQFAHLTGGVGFVVDSPVPGGNGIGAIINRNGNNILVEARPDVGATAYSFGPLTYRFVNSLDGTTPASVSSLSFDFVGGIATGFSDSATFYDADGNLLTTISRTDNGVNQNVSYSNAAGIVRVDLTTSFSMATDNVTFIPEVVIASTPEPSSLALFISLGISGGVFALRRRRK